MATFKLAFAYQGHQPGDVVDVPDQAVKELVRAGVGHLEGAEPVLRLGHLPEVAQPQTPAEETAAGDTEPAPVKRSRKAATKPAE
ncbi:hypothetical protein ACWDA7_14080 [Streptomyces sp. NPDC001156]